MNMTVIDNTDEVKKRLEAALDAAFTMCGLKMEGYAKQRCPVRTGNLRNSLTNDTSSKHAFVGTDVEYGPYVEYGASGRTPKPYVVPAVTDHLDEYKRIIETAINL